MLNNKITNDLKLSDVLDLSEFKIDKLNIVNAPTCSGKTYAAINHISKLRGERRMLYLIDTSAGEENILNTYDEIEKYDRAAVKAVLNEDTVGFKTVATIMTYAKFGYLIKQDALDLKTFGLIVCDELQSLMSYMEWSEKPLKKAYPFATDEDRLEFLTKSSLPHIAFHTLVRILDDAEQEIFIIALSATPRMILANINNHIMINLINICNQKTHKYGSESNYLPDIIMASL